MGTDETRREEKNYPRCAKKCPRPCHGKNGGPGPERPTARTRTSCNAAQSRSTFGHPQIGRDFSGGGARATPAVSPRSMHTLKKRRKSKERLDQKTCSPPETLNQKERAGVSRGRARKFPGGEWRKSTVRSGHGGGRGDPYGRLTRRTD